MDNSVIVKVASWHVPNALTQALLLAVACTLIVSV